MPGVYNKQSNGGSIAIKDEGITIASAASSIDFTGAGVSGSAVGSAVTETITGTGSASLLSESANETPDGSRTSFTFTHNVGVVTLNGVNQYVGGNLSSITTNTAVFNDAPQTGDDVKNLYVA